MTDELLPHGGLPPRSSMEVIVGATLATTRSLEKLIEVLQASTQKLTESAIQAAAERKALREYIEEHDERIAKLEARTSGASTADVQGRWQVIAIIATGLMSLLALLAKG